MVGSFKGRAKSPDDNLQTYEIMSEALEVYKIQGIRINPVTKEMAIRVKSIWILNEFYKLGFDQRSDFINAVVDKDREYFRYPKTNLLENYWLGRKHEEAFNERMEAILNQIKAEANGNSR